MFQSFHDALTDEAATYIDSQLASFEDTFATVPPEKSDEWLEILLNLLGLGFSAAAAPFFDSCKLSKCIFLSLSPHSVVVLLTLSYSIVLASKAFFIDHPAILNNAKDTTFPVIAFGTAIAVATLKPGSP